MIILLGHHFHINSHKEPRINNQGERQKLRKELKEQHHILTARIEGGETLLEGSRIPGLPNKDGLLRDFSKTLRRAFLKARAKRKVKAVEVALERLDEGEYGKCANCGAEIDENRLEVLPTAVLCYQCSQDNTELNQTP
jgi:RNA polymerase-binding transcription factor DksA